MGRGEAAVLQDRYRPPGAERSVAELGGSVSLDDSADCKHSTCDDGQCVRRVELGGRMTALIVNTVQWRWVRLIRDQSDNRSI